MNNIQEQLDEIVVEKGISKIILDYKKHLEWRQIIENYNEDWAEISKDKDLTPDFIKCFRDKINLLHNYTQNRFAYDLEEYPDVEYSDMVKWLMISINKNISEEFIEKHQEKIQWEYIRIRKDLSDEFIAKFLDKLQCGCEFHGYGSDCNGDCQCSCNY